MADRPGDPEALEEYIERNIQELARNVDEVCDRVHPRKVAQRSADRLKEEAAQVAKAVGALVNPSAGGDGDGDPEGGGVDKRLVMAGVGAAVTVTTLVLWRRGRRRRRR